MAKNAVAKTKSAGLPANLAAEMEADAGDGMQNVTTQDMAIPFLRILQKMSPQLSKRDGAYVAGASEGDIINTVTGQLWEANEGLVVIPCDFNFKIIEWRPRDTGGGLVAVYDRDDRLPEHTKDDRGRLVTKDGNYLEDTAEHFVLIVNEDGSCEQALIAMSSTQLKHSRKWNSLIAQRTISTSEGVKPAPRYSAMYRLKTQGEENAQGDWSGWDITLEKPVEDLELYRAARTFSKAVRSGQVQVKREQDPVQSSEVM